MDEPQELPIPKELWDTIPPAAQAALLVVFGQMRQRIVQLEARVVALQAKVADSEAQLGPNSSIRRGPP